MASKDTKELVEKVTGPFPSLEEVVPRHTIWPGFQWAYVKVKNFTSYAEDQWVQAPGSQPFVVEDEAYMAMRKGRGTRGSVGFIPEVFIDVVGYPG